MKNTQKGFTLVELLVVIAILAILAGVGVAGYSAFIGRAEVSNAETEAHQIESAINSFLMVDDEYELENTVDMTKAGSYYRIYVVEGTDGKLDAYKVVINVASVDGKLVATAEDPDVHTGTISLAGTDFATLPGTLFAQGGELRYIYDLGTDKVASADDAHVVIE